MVERMVIVTNETAGTGAAPAELEALARQVGLAMDVVASPPGQDLRAVARKLARSGYGTVVAAGGDGTASAVAAGILGEDCTLGIIPLGTFNHLARDLGIPPDPREAMRALQNGRIIPVDAGEVNGHIFMNNSGIGLYPLFVADRERQERELNRPKWRAAIFAWLTALWIYPMLHVRITAEGRRLERRTPILFVGNNEYELQGGGVGGRKCIDAGRLCLLVTRATSRLGLLWLGLLALVGRLDRAGNLDALVTTELEVHVRLRNLPVSMDGEVHTLQTPLRYRIHRRALRVIVPRLQLAEGSGGQENVHAAAPV